MAGRGDVYCSPPWRNGGFCHLCLDRGSDSTCLLALGSSTKWAFLPALAATWFQTEPFMSQGYACIGEWVSAQAWGWHNDVGCVCVMPVPTHPSYATGYKKCCRSKAKSYAQFWIAETIWEAPAILGQIWSAQCVLARLPQHVSLRPIIQSFVHKKHTLHICLCYYGFLWDSNCDCFRMPCDHGTSWFSVVISVSEKPLGTSLCVRSCHI